MRKHYKVYRAKDLGLFKEGTYLTFNDKHLKVCKKDSKTIPIPCFVCAFNDEHDCCKGMSVDCEKHYYKEVDYYEILFLNKGDE